MLCLNKLDCISVVTLHCPQNILSGILREPSISHFGNISNLWVISEGMCRLNAFYHNCRNKNFAMLHFTWNPLKSISWIIKENIICTIKFRESGVISLFDIQCNIFSFRNQIYFSLFCFPFWSLNVAPQNLRGGGCFNPPPSPPIKNALSYVF